MVDSRAQSKRPGLPKSSNILLLFFLFATLDLIIFASMPVPIKKKKVNLVYDVFLMIEGKLMSLVSCDTSFVYITQLCN
jgi:hypothetical protein